MKKHAKKHAKMKTTKTLQLLEDRSDAALALAEKTNRPQHWEAARAAGEAVAQEAGIYENTLPEAERKEFRHARATRSLRRLCAYLAK